MKSVTLIIIALSYTCLNYAQTTFEKTYGGFDIEHVNDGTQTSTGDYLIFGFINYQNAADLYLIKVNSEGDSIWTKNFGGSLGESGSSIIETSDSNYLMCAYTKSQGSGSTDFYIIKTDTSGALIWEETFGGPFVDEPHSITETLDNGYLITGRTVSSANGSNDIIILKIDSAGNSLWQKTYEWNVAFNSSYYSDVGYSIVQTSDGGYALGGYSQTLNKGWEMILIKTDINGDSLWTKTYGGAQDEICYSLSQTSDGGFLLVGATTSYSMGGEDIYIVKTDSYGDTLWTKSYGDIGPDYARSGLENSNGDFVLTGYHYSTITSVGRLIVLKYDVNGNLIWEMSYGNPGSIGVSIKETMDNGYAVFGHSPDIHLNQQALLLKTNQEGSISSLKPYSNLTSIQIYPNPSSTGLIQLNTSIVNSDINVYSIEGKQINFTQSNNVIDISDNEKGVYLVSIDGIVTRYVYQE